MKTSSAPSAKPLSPPPSTHPSREVGAEDGERCISELHSEALLSNYAVLAGRAPGHELLPMVKANAYGHDARWVARQLASQVRLFGFGVATLDEGVALRLAYPQGRIVVFGDCTPWSEEKAQRCERHGFTPVIATLDDWRRFRRSLWPRRLPYHLKFNTGMNRLGIPAELCGEILADLGPVPPPEGVLSHLAVGEAPNHPVSRKQKKLFSAIHTEFATRFPSTRFHLANSAGIWNAKGWDLSHLTQIVRPGLSLYGIRPWPGARPQGLRPVLHLRARVVARHDLRPGDTIGYGATYIHRGRGVAPVAILAMGYGDGLHRALSNTPKNRGQIWLEGKRRPFLGRISMDLSAIGCGPATPVGAWAEILGPHVDPWRLAEQAGTIPYELLTSLSERVKKNYV